MDGIFNTLLFFLGIKSFLEFNCFPDSTSYFKVKRERGRGCEGMNWGHPKRTKNPRRMPKATKQVEMSFLHLLVPGKQVKRPSLLSAAFYLLLACSNFE